MTQRHRLHYLHWIWKFPLHVVEFFCLFCCLYAFGILAFGAIPVNSDFVQTPEGIPLYIHSNGVHTDAIVPVVTEHIDWREYIVPDLFEPEPNGLNYIAFGWGDKGFYLETPTWADLKFSVAAKAVLLPSETAMHVSYSSTPPELGEMTRLVYIDAAQYNALIDYIKSSFETDPEGTLFPIVTERDDYVANDRFYEAYGSYSCFKTCNVWTNSALKATGVRTPLWGPYPGSIFSCLDE